MIFERKPFEVRELDNGSGPLRLRYTPEPDTDMWVVTTFAEDLNGELNRPVFNKLTTNVMVERDYNYFSSHWRDYDVKFLGDEQ